MNLDRVTALNDATRELMATHTYFLTAAAGACIGFTLTKLSGNANTAAQWLIVFSLLAWAVCFLSGVMHAEIQMEQMKYNADRLLLKTKTGHYRNIDEKLQMERDAVLRDRLERFNRRGSNLWKAQYWSMLLGASAFIFSVVLPSIFNGEVVGPSRLENLVEIRVQVR